MPTLNFSGKDLPPTPPSALCLEASTYPAGIQKTIESNLYLADNLELMSALLPAYAGKINLIYADPPFFTNRKFTARIGRGEDSRKPHEWVLASGYLDDWDDLDAYLSFLYQRLKLMHSLLAEDGSLYLHLDWHASAYARLLLDEIFGAGRLVNEIAWVYHGPSPIRSAFNRKHDTILFYSKSKDYFFNADAVRVPYNPSTVNTFAASAKAGFGKTPNLARGKVPEDWWYFPVVARLHNERTGYPTQKPGALLERIITASSRPRDLVADFFCGSGTTAVTAARLGRHFLASDFNWRAIHTTRKRLIQENEPFNLKRSASQNWQLETRNPPFLAHRSVDSVTLSGDLSALNYWEIDPHWDGEIFKSMAQSALPVRSGEIASSLPLPENSLGGQVAIRAVLSSGMQYQILV